MDAMSTILVVIMLWARQRLAIASRRETSSLPCAMKPMRDPLLFLSLPCARPVANLHVSCRRHVHAPSRDVQNKRQDTCIVVTCSGAAASVRQGPLERLRSLTSRFCLPAVEALLTAPAGTARQGFRRSARNRSHGGLRTARCPSRVSCYRRWRIGQWWANAHDGNQIRIRR